MGNEDKEKESQQGVKLAESINLACQSKFGVLESEFLCGSVSLLGPAVPICVLPTTLLGEVVAIFRKEKIGCVLVTDAKGVLVGIFSERDLVMKVDFGSKEILNRPIEELMTREPVSEPPTIAVAYALSLMSQGGFRHLPLVDEARKPVGIVSVKNLVDWLAAKTFDDLMKFEN